MKSFKIGVGQGDGGLINDRCWDVSGFQREKARIDFYCITSLRISYRSKT
jgi:hypothetical protein